MDNLMLEGFAVTFDYVSFHMLTNLCQLFSGRLNVSSKKYRTLNAEYQITKWRRLLRNLPIRVAHFLPHKSHQLLYIRLAKIKFYPCRFIDLRNGFQIAEL